MAFKYQSNAFAGEYSQADKKRFYTASGWLSPYALACGYMESIIFQKQNPAFPADIIMSLQKDGLYQVKAFNHTTGMRIEWSSHETLSQARAAFSKLKNKIIRDNAPRYEVQHLIGNEWENTWRDDAGENNLDGAPVTYATKTQAQAALSEFLRDTMQDYKAGNLSAPYSRSEFRVSIVGVKS